jgi:hypothetical protein
VYQKSNAAGSMIREFHSLLEGEPEGEYLRLLK